MRGIHRNVIAFLIGAALAAPIGLQAAVARQDEHRDERRPNEYARRDYDRDRRDYHRWNRSEANAYRRRQRERGERRAFARLNRREQYEYWNWRHIRITTGTDRPG
jgi:hypothetical protein